MVEHLRASEIYRYYHKAFEATTGLPLSLRKTGAFQPPLHDSKLINSLCAILAGQNQTCAACLQLQQRNQAAFTWLLVPETKQKTLKEIEA